MDNSKKLEKIQKCLRLSKSANPNEAAIALRQAQKLMDELGIDENELEALGYGEQSIDIGMKAHKDPPVQLSRLNSLMKKSFGVDAVCERRRTATGVLWRVRYFGPKTRVPMACYAHQVIWRAVENAWQDYLAVNLHLKKDKYAKISFQLGWLVEITEKVVAIGFTEEEKAQTTSLMENYYAGTMVTKAPKSTKVFNSVMQKGADAAKDFEIHRPVNGKSQLAIGA